MDFLAWVRGPLFDGALVIFIVGVLWRLLEIVMLGRKRELSEPAGNAAYGGLRTIAMRFWPEPGGLKKSAVIVIGGWVFHLGFFIALLLYVPHIELVHQAFGVSWPGLPSPVVDAATVIGMVALVVLLLHRLTDPVRRFLSTFQDYLIWAMAFLPLLTGYLAYHHIVEPYTTALALHILSVEILMVVFPFTKLMHTFTLFMGRWYNGAMAGHRGVHS
ncbi:MAG: hypothetical protein PVF91_10245 [Chromatiales bacterium]|jgi:nitrate reductase gamma subunit